jgi:hypothetical protein
MAALDNDASFLPKIILVRALIKGHDPTLENERGI